MKRTLEILLVGLVAGGLLTGCPKKEEATTDEPAPATATQEEPAAPATAAQEEPKAEVNEENYLKAMYEVSCVRAKVEDTEKQKEIIAEIYPRYGFTEETFTAAQTAMANNATVKVALDKKMEECTPEVALGFLTAAGEGADAGAAAAADEKAEPKKTAPARAWKSGTYNDSNITGGGFDKTSLRVSISDEGKVTGSLKGTREGKGFMIPISGEVSKDGRVNASGNKGPNNARLSVSRPSSRSVTATRSTRRSRPSTR